MQGEIQPITARQTGGDAPFAAVRNRIRIHRQHKELSRIVDSAGVLLREADASGDKVSSSELTDMICSVTFMMSALGFLLAQASSCELESSAVLNIIDRAEVMVGIMGGAVLH